MPSKGPLLAEPISRRHYSRHLPYVWGFVLAAFLTGGMVRAGFCFIDDHWQALWLGKSGAFPWSRIWPNILDTEVGQLGSGGRFRPVYFLYIELETWILGNRPGLYHLLRLVYFGLFLGAAGKIAARCVGLMPALACVTGLAGLAFWANLWTLSFGPAEQIAVLGLSLLMMAADGIVPALLSDEDRVPAWALPTASAGAAIAAGSKENFVVFVGILAVLVVALVLRRRLRPLSTVLAILPLIVPGLVLYALYAAGKNKTDFYGADNSAFHRIAEMTEHPGFLTWWVGSILVAALLGLLAYRRSRLPRDRLRFGLLIFLSMILFLAAEGLWEMFFYAGRLPSGIRYDFPFVLLPAAIMIGVVGFLRFAFFEGGGCAWRLVQAALLVVMLTYLRSAQLGLSLPTAVAKAVAQTSSFREDFMGLRTTAAAHPDWPLVLEANDPWDYEPVASIKIWARFFGIENPLLVRLDTIPQTAIKDPFEASLVKALSDMARGTGEVVPRLADPTGLDRLDGRCFAISVSLPARSPCERPPIRLEHYIPNG